MLEFQNVSYQYPSEDFDIIDHLSFAVEPGSFHCIIGISGCGKSTIFRMTNGLLKPKAGTILVEGKSIVGRKHYCGYMPQKDLLFPWRTVGENVALPLEIQGELTRAERRDRAEAALADVGLAGCGSKMPDELSGGMRQRAAFARTMLTGCDLLLLDEPFSALDFLTRISMQEWLLDQWQRHKRTSSSSPTTWRRRCSSPPACWWWSAPPSGSWRRFRSPRPSRGTAPASNCRRWWS